MGPFEVLSETFKPQHNETILSLQYCKLRREQSENVEEWIDPLRMKANECKYKERDRGLKEQCLDGTNNDQMMLEII